MIVVIRDFRRSDIPGHSPSAPWDQHRRIWRALVFGLISLGITVMMIALVI
jgi:hypothetical protein